MGSWVPGLGSVSELLGDSWGVMSHLLGVA